jgi:hypothetical protein
MIHALDFSNELKELRLEMGELKRVAPLAKQKGMNFLFV